MFCSMGGLSRACSELIMGSNEAIVRSGHHQFQASGDESDLRTE